MNPSAFTRSTTRGVVWNNTGGDLARQHPVPATAGPPACSTAACAVTAPLAAT